jgi:hypothetical protein
MQPPNPMPFSSTFRLPEQNNRIQLFELKQFNEFQD